jgi:hypothetical protein
MIDRDETRQTTRDVVKLEGAVVDALYDVLDNDYAVATLAMIAKGRWDYDYDPAHRGAVGIYDCELAQYVAVLYLADHHLGTDIETTDSFEDVLEAAFGGAR